MKIFYKNNTPVHLNFVSYIKSSQDINQENHQLIEEYIVAKTKSEEATIELEKMEKDLNIDFKDKEFDETKNFLKYGDAINEGIKKMCSEEISRLEKIGQERSWEDRNMQRCIDDVLVSMGYIKDKDFIHKYSVMRQYSVMDQIGSSMPIREGQDYYHNRLIEFCKSRESNSQECIDKNLFPTPFFATKEKLADYKKYLLEQRQEEINYLNFLLKENELRMIIRSVQNDPRIWRKIFFYDYLDTKKVVATWEFDTEEEMSKVYNILQKRLGQTTEEIIID